MTQAATDFIAQTFALSRALQAATQGRIFAFESRQGTHTYPFILWSIVSDRAMTTDLQGAGQPWQAELQVNCYAQSVRAAENLARMVYDAFTTAPRTKDILHVYSTQVIPLYVDEDESIEYALRIFINYQN